jgi:hypothetical protein
MRDLGQTSRLRADYGDFAISNPHGDIIDIANGRVLERADDVNPLVFEEHPGEGLSIDDGGTGPSVESTQMGEEASIAQRQQGFTNEFRSIISGDSNVRPQHRRRYIENAVATASDQELPAILALVEEGLSNSNLPLMIRSQLSNSRDSILERQEYISARRWEDADDEIPF